MHTIILRKQTQTKHPIGLILFCVYFPFIRIRYIKTITINTHIDCLNNTKCSVRDILLATKQGAFESVFGTFSVIKDKLRKGDVELPEIEQILEDKYQAMKDVKGWDKEEDDYAVFTSQADKKKCKKAFKGHCAYYGEVGHKAADCPNKKSNQNKGSKGNPKHKKKHSTKEDHKGNGHRDMSKIKCFNCGEYGHFA